MRWVTFRRGADDADRVGVVVDAQVHALPAATTLLGLLGDDGEALAARRDGACATLPRWCRSTT